MEFYTEKDIQNILKLGKKQAHALMQTKEFPAIRVGSAYRISVDKFEKWANQTKEIKLNYEHI